MLRELPIETSTDEATVETDPLVKAYKDFNETLQRECEILYETIAHLHHEIKAIREQHAAEIRRIQSQIKNI